MKDFSDKQIVDSWTSNAKPWIQAIQGNEIESRNLVTNKAIVNAIKKLPGKSVLDIGCGEGWLLAELSSLGFTVSGLDVNPELLTQAKKNVQATFYEIAYENITEQSFTQTFDIIVCNFSLIGHESVNHVFTVVPKLLNKGGCFIIQTLHPKTNSDEAYEDGWKEGSWAGFNDEFSNPAPWYFRTLETWHNLFSTANLSPVDIIEPVHPKTGKPVSIIMFACLLN